MKIRTHTWQYLCILLFFFIIPLFPLLSAKSYTIDRIDIHAQISPNGDMQIEEARTYTFKGNFSWATYIIPLRGIGDIRYFNLSDEYREYSRSSEEVPGTYYLQKTEDQFYCKWFYRAKNETRTFTLRYIATDVITEHKDIAEFYYKFVGEANEKIIGTVSVVIQLPQHADTTEVRAFAHGPLWGTISFDNGKLNMNISPLPAYQYWEARVLFPTNWVPDAKRRSLEIKLSAILAEEALWAKTANERRLRTQKYEQMKKEKEAKAWNYSIILSIIGVLGLAYFYSKYGRGFKVPYYQKIDSELPRDQPPAIVSALYFNKEVYGTALSATLFDLARRGFITIEQTTPPEKKWWGTTAPQFSIKFTDQQIKEETNVLLDYEKDLLEFIKHELGKGSSIVELKVFKKNRSKVQKWFRDWRKLVCAHFKDDPYYDKPSVKGTIYAAILSSLIITGGVIIMVTLGTPGVLAIIAGSFCIGLSFTILRYTPGIKLKRKKWKALREYLKKYHFVSEYNQDWLKNIEKYLVYGIALGIGKKVIEKMMESVPTEQQTALFPWYYHGYGAHPSPADFASAISSMVNIASTTMSSSTGAGGGASSGGGGGGGGASGGAG